ncbi:MAG: glycosyltransferase family A protein [Thermoplasmata archaeon]
MGCSVVVCTTGEKSDLLVKCLDSLSEQTYEDLEVICVSSVESLPEEVQSTAQVLVEKRHGISIAKNVGIRAAEHEIVALTDDDCICEPNWVEKLVEEFKEESVGCVTGGSVPTRQGLWYASTSWHTDRRVFKKSDGFVPPWEMGARNNISLRKDVITKIGLFDEELGPGKRYRGAEDIDVFQRVMGAGCDIVYTPEALVKHEPLDTRSQVRTMMLGYRIGIGAFFAKHRYSAEAKRYFRRIYLRTQLRNSKNNFLNGNMSLGWTYLVGYIGAQRGYYGYIMSH